MSKKEINQRLHQSRMWRESAKALARLKRFEEREPLVQELLDAVGADEECDCDWDEVVATHAAVRDFALVEQRTGKPNETEVVPVRTLAWELLTAVELGVITVSDKAARDRFEGAKRGLRDYFVTHAVDAQPAEQKPVDGVRMTSNGIFVDKKSGKVVGHALNPLAADLDAAARAEAGEQKPVDGGHCSYQAADAAWWEMHHRAPAASEPTVGKRVGSEHRAEQMPVDGAVESALEWVSAGFLPRAGRPTVEAAATVLAAEVRRLRELNAAMAAEVQRLTPWWKNQLPSLREAACEIREIHRLRAELERQAKLADGYLRTCGELKTEAERLSKLHEDACGRALRAGVERDEARSKLDLVAQERDKRMAKIARVEQLPARWRASFTEPNEDYEHILMETCSEALEDALRE